ncbi:MAG: rhamnulose-1-phosphate aldolase [Eggerthellaceae bacterium]|jgi:rhamnulose-1-phosphate aldolase
MSIEQSNCIRRFTRLCTDGYEQGWHEGNGGNLSYRMTPEDVEVCMPYLDAAGSPWIENGVSVPNLGGEFIIVTGAGKYMRKVALDLHTDVGIIEINPEGDGYRVVWGFTDGAQPTSEWPSHLLTHSTNVACGRPDDRVVYHAHVSNSVALTNVVPADSKTITHLLWRSMCEAILMFPEGIGAMGFKAPGSTDVAYSNADLMKSHRCAIWAHHGAIVTAKTFDEAFGMMQTLEKAASIYKMNRAMCGGSEPQGLLTDDQLREICASYEVTPNPEYL